MKNFLEDILENFDDFFEFVKHISSTHTEEECRVIMDKMFDEMVLGKTGIDLSNVDLKMEDIKMPKPPKKNKT